MIFTVEERVNEVLSQLPTMDGLSVHYAWGDEKHLNTLIGLKPDSYPLIYQTSKDETEHRFEDKITTTWEAILAVSNTNTDLMNTERWALAFRNYLNPLAEMISKGFESADFLIEKGEVHKARYGNYGDANEHFTIDIWDALTYRCTLTIHDRPICPDRLIFT